MSVFRSAHHTYAQVINDDQGVTLVAASTAEEEVRQQAKAAPKKAAARQVGKLLAERAKAQGVKRVVFDRGGYKYHGRVKELADGAREEGLEF